MDLGKEVVANVDHGHYSDENGQAPCRVVRNFQQSPVLLSWRKHGVGQKEHESEHAYCGQGRTEDFIHP
jgi:hypothetical protein